ncbi:MAG: acyltransferase [Mucilaginibacter sp.]|uniref:acyltransferase n=1 Tax=Mucilaginibacter sp. TaxID=1882438 RepID=UPI0031A2C902
MNKYQRIYAQCKAVKTSFIGVVLRLIYYKVCYKITVLSSSNTYVEGMANIKSGGTLKIGLKKLGFTFKKDATYLNIRGKLNIRGDYSIAKGCRFDIGPQGVVNIGSGGFINANSLLIIMHKLTIGDDCSISWNTQFLDDNFHQLEYEGKKDDKNNEIAIGNHVWIGCNCFFYKGSRIPDNCIVAANSVVKDAFYEENTLIGGNPAKVIKRNVNWK